MRPTYKSFFRPNLKESIETFKESILSAVVDLDTDNPTDEQILRIATASEQSAVNLYQQLASLTNNDIIKKVLLDIIDEEKVHIGEFEHTLSKFVDADAQVLSTKGSHEVDDLLNK